MRHVLNCVALFVVCGTSLALTAGTRGQADHNLSLIAHDSRDPQWSEAPPPPPAVPLPMAAHAGGPIIMSLGPPPVVYSPSADFGNRVKNDAGMAAVSDAPSGRVFSNPTLPPPQPAIACPLGCNAVGEAIECAIAWNQQANGYAPAPFAPVPTNCVLPPPPTSFGLPPNFVPQPIYTAAVPAPFGHPSAFAPGPMSYPNPISSAALHANSPFASSACNCDPCNCNPCNCGAGNFASCNNGPCNCDACSCDACKCGSSCAALADLPASMSVAAVSPAIAAVRARTIRKSSTQPASVPPPMRRRTAVPIESITFWKPSTIWMPPACKPTPTACVTSAMRK